MGLIASLPGKGGNKKDLQLTFGLTVEEINADGTFFPPEWHPQSGVQLTWPHAKTDWAYMLDEVTACFTEIAAAISQREQVLIVAPDTGSVEKQLKGKVRMENVRFFQCGTNDTWARDHSAISLIGMESPLLLDFCFNGWGMKFAANLDNQITRRLHETGCLHGKYVSHLDYVLEGGSIETDGKGTLLTTSACLLSRNRNDKLDRKDVEMRLRSMLHVDRILWLDHGYLAGDDTGSHIDTLARMCPDDTIAYVKCDDERDEHFTALKEMEKQLQSFRTKEGNPYRLLPLPMPAPVYADGERLPATYANFLAINGALLFPTYAQPEQDAEAAKALAQAFPGREIIGIDCRPLIKQHGSLHCVTMQYPQNILK